MEFNDFLKELIVNQKISEKESDLLNNLLMTGTDLVYKIDNIGSNLDSALDIISNKEFVNILVNSSKEKLTESIEVCIKRIKDCFELLKLSESEISTGIEAVKERFEIYKKVRHVTF